MIPTRDKKSFYTRGNCVSALGQREQGVLRQAVQTMAAGHTPTVETLSRELRLPIVAVRQVLLSLQECDCVVMDGDRVRVAYPFTSDPVSHEVVSSRGTARANCALDALGVGAMLGEEVEIRSVCPYCGTPIRLRGRRNFQGPPERPVVFLPPRDSIQGHAANCVCPTINFYCTEEHGSAHLSDLAGRGRFLSLEEATALGIAAFANLVGRTSNLPGSHDLQQ